MKKLFTLFIAGLFAAALLAQAPQKMSYQAVVRNASGALVTGQGVGMKISILQGSPTGSLIYQEIYNPNPQTNENGLLSLEIGEGIPLTGTFSTIDWSNGPYYLMTETDPSGGTNYTISGTSQLLSVPYALYADSAENYTESDPLFDISAASGITGANISDWNAAWDWGDHASAGYVPDSRSLNINGTSLDLKEDRSFNVGTVTSIGLSLPKIFSLTGSPITSSGTLTATLVSQTANQVFAAPVKGPGLPVFRTLVSTDIPALSWSKITTGLPTTLAGYGITDGVKTYSIGDFAQGGIVFWVDETGQHGLVCAKTDQSDGVRWYSGTNGNTQAKGDGPFAGEANTSIIIAAQVAIGDDGTTYAARICNELEITEGGKTYGDWYLPSLAELKFMHFYDSQINATAILNGGSSFIYSEYWSSTEYNWHNAYAYEFGHGYEIPHDKFLTQRVRAIRAF
jgi:hypothetical protein